MERKHMNNTERAWASYRSAVDSARAHLEALGLPPDEMAAAIAEIEAEAYLAYQEALGLPFIPHEDDV